MGSRSRGDRRPRVTRPEEAGVDPSAPLPPGTRLGLEPGVSRPAPDVLIGGRPRRLLRLSETGAGAMGEILTGPVTSPAGRVLGRRLTDAGVAWVLAPGAPARPADPGAPARAPDAAVTVVVPVRDRPGQLERCLAALAAGTPVVVVDDGSVDRAAVAAVASAAGATAVRRERPGGPAAARNAGLAVVTTPLVAFVDSDCTVAAGWLEGLVHHFADPLVAAAAPRVVGSAGPSPLDMGRAALPVRPGSPVPYVPTAALVARVAALGDGFDEDLRHGEDVDLVWRLVDAGWRVRYDPSVEILHEEGARVPARMARRFAYGTSAGALALRHPRRLAPVVASPGPASAVAAALCGRPALGALAAAGTAAAVARRARRLGLGAEAAGMAGRALAGTWLAAGRWCRQSGAPLAAAIAALPGRRRWARRAAVGAAVLAPSAMRALGRRPPGPAPATLLEDLSYGAGVVVGSLRAGTWEPLVPRVGRASPVGGVASA